MKSSAAPGTLLIREMLAWAFARGLETYEFLGADESFKLESHLGLRSVQLVVLVNTDEVTAVLHAGGRDPRIERRATMRQLPEHIAGVVAELDCGG